MKLLNWLLKAMITVYRYTLSPLLGKNCRYLPTCSEYAYVAIDRFGSFKGGYLAIRRISRCHPWGGSGFDPVPEKDAPAKDCNCETDIDGSPKK